ncbi:MAG: copper chaperone PCu(A)C [Alphaproteobacteria bacterium]
MKAAIVLAGLGLLAVVVWLGVGPAQRSDHLLITDVQAAPLDDGGALAFMTIENRGAPDRLIAVDSPVAEASLYSPAVADGPPVPTGKSALALDGAHIRLAAPREAFADGSLIPLTLTFAEAGEVAVKARLADPKAGGAAGEVGLFGLGDICVVGEGEPAPAITLSATPEKDGFRVRVTAEDFTFSEDFVDLYHVPGMGHAHLYVGGMKIGRLYTPEAYIGALPKGQHEIRVTLNTNDHRAYVVGDQPVTASAVIEVD